MRQKVNIYDTKEHRITHHGLSLTDVAKALDTTYNNLTNSMYRNGLVKYRYKILKAGYIVKPEPDPQKEDSFCSDIVDLANRWDDAVEPFRILKRRLGK